MNSELSLDTAFVGSVSSKQQSSWTTTLQVRGKEIRFKIDTGAEVTAISEKNLSTARWSKSTKAKECPVRSSSTYSRCTGAVYDHTEVQATLLSLQPVFVVLGLKNNLLGLPAIVALQLIHRVSSVKTEDGIHKMFPKVFSGLIGDAGRGVSDQVEGGSLTILDLCS